MEMDLNLAYTRNRCVKSASVTGTVWGQRAGPRSPSMVKFGCSCSVVGALRVSGTGRLGDHCTFGCFGAGSRMDRGAGVAQGTGAGAFAAVLFRGNRLSPGGPRGAGEPGRNLGGRGCGTPVPRWPVRSGGTGRQSGQTRRPRWRTRGVGRSAGFQLPKQNSLVQAHLPENKHLATTARIHFRFPAFSQE